MPLVEVRQFFDVVKSVYNYFSCSYRRWHLLMSQPQCSGFPQISDDTDTVHTPSAEFCDYSEHEDSASGSKPRTLRRSC